MSKYIIEQWGSDPDLEVVNRYTKTYSYEEIYNTSNKDKYAEEDKKVNGSRFKDGDTVILEFKIAGSYFDKEVDEWMYISGGPLILSESELLALNAVTVDGLVKQIRRMLIDEISEEFKTKKKDCDEGCCKCQG